jgi:transposase
MKENLRFLGLDVHAETIAVAIAEPDGEVRSLGTTPNRAESIRKLIKKLGQAEKLRACYDGLRRVLAVGEAGHPVRGSSADVGTG